MPKGESDQATLLGEDLGSVHPGEGRFALNCHAASEKFCYSSLEQGCEYMASGGHWGGTVRSEVGKSTGTQLEGPLMYKKVFALFLKGRELFKRF